MRLKGVKTQSARTLKRVPAGLRGQLQSKVSYPGGLADCFWVPDGMWFMSLCPALPATGD